MCVFKDQIEFIHVNYYEPNILISSIEVPPLDNSSSETKNAVNSILEKIYLQLFNYFITIK
jgi:hypothetical protein